MNKTPKLTQEDIYQHLVKQEYREIIFILHKHRESLKKDESIHYAINIFLTEFFGHVEKSALVDDVKCQLQHLFILHSQRFYTLPEHFAKKVIGILWDGNPNQMWYEAAKPYLTDLVCATIMEKYEAQQQRQQAEVRMKSDPDLAKYVTGSSTHFQIELVRQGPGAPYLRVYVRGEGNLEPLQDLLIKLPTVSKANLTERVTGKKNLTVYLQPPFDLTELNDQVDGTLEAYFNTMPSDPIFKSEVISAISDTAYFQVIDYMIGLGQSLERSKRSAAAWNENMFRDYFLRFLDALSESHTATGEAFNADGKTEILVRDKAKNNLLIAECKMWTGSSGVAAAIDQLLGRYITWRDEKAAIFFFNNTAKGFSDVVEKAVAAVKAHPLCHLMVGTRRETSFSFIFKNGSDSTKTIQLELVLFNFV